MFFNTTSKKIVIISFLYIISSITIESSTIPAQQIIEENQIILTKINKEILRIQGFISIMNDDYAHFVHPKPIDPGIIGDFRGTCTSLLQSFYKNLFINISTKNQQLFLQINPILQPFSKTITEQLAILWSLIFDLSETYNNVYQYEGQMPEYTKNLIINFNGKNYKKTLKEWLQLSISNSGFEKPGELFKDIYDTLNTKSNITNKITSWLQNSSLKVILPLAGITIGSALLLWLYSDSITPKIIELISSYTGLTQEVIMQNVTTLQKFYGQITGVNKKYNMASTVYNKTTALIAPSDRDHESLPESNYLENLKLLNSFRDNPANATIFEYFDDTITTLTKEISNLQTIIKKLEANLADCQKSSPALSSSSSEQQLSASLNMMPDSETEILTSPKIMQRA